MLIAPRWLGGLIGETWYVNNRMQAVFPIATLREPGVSDWSGPFVADIFGVWRPIVLPP